MRSKCCGRRKGGVCRHCQFACTMRRWRRGWRRQALMLLCSRLEMGEICSATPLPRCGHRCPAQVMFERPRPAGPLPWRRLGTQPGIRPGMRGELTRALRLRLSGKDDCSPKTLPDFDRLPFPERLRDARLSPSFVAMSERGLCALTGSARCITRVVACRGSLHGTLVLGHCVSIWYICVTFCAKRSDGPEVRAP